MELPRLKQLLPHAAAGLLIGFVIVIIVTSYASLVFAEVPPVYLARGVGVTLFGAFVIGLLTALTSSLPGIIAYPQDNPAAILALVATNIIGSVAATATFEATFATLMVAITLTSLLTGAFFILLGSFQLGSLIRYLPYPVIGGFLAGTGALLVRGAIRSMTGVPLQVSHLPMLLTVDLVVHWLPGLVLGIVLLVTTRRYSHFLLFPAILSGAIVLFYLLLWASGTAAAEATQQGYLLGPFPAGSLWQPLPLSLLVQADWSSIGNNIGNISTVALISVVALLLNASSLELLREHDVDFNRELRVAGMANLLGGLGGSPVGHPSLSSSTLVHAMGASSRFTGIVAALVCGAMLVGGASLLSFVPRFLLGAILLFLGFNFLLTWLYESWFRLSKLDYLVIVLILLGINVVGVLPGVGLGIALAVVLFVGDYSRVSVVKHALSGTTYRSTVDRPRDQRQLLRDRGECLYILELQGFIFFGTANKVLDEVRKRLTEPMLAAPRFVLLDFRQVSGLDASAVLSFAKMLQLTRRHDVMLLITHLSDLTHRRLFEQMLGELEGTHWCRFPDLDHGLEWCEEQLLRAVGATEVSRSQRVREQLADLLPDTDVGLLVAYMERMDVEPGDVLIHQGTESRGLYFIQSGRLTAQLEYPDGRILRLRTMQPGVFVGELSLYTRGMASASVVADEPSTVHYLAMDRLAQLQKSHPHVAAEFHALIAQLVSERLVDSTRTLRALMR